MRVSKQQSHITSNTQFRCTVIARPLVYPEHTDYTCTPMLVSWNITTSTLASVSYLLIILSVFPLVIGVVQGKQIGVVV